MDLHLLLARLKNLRARTPMFGFGLTREGQEWLGQVHALMSRWDAAEAVAFAIASDALAGRNDRLRNIQKIMNMLERAIADVELKLPDTPDQIFGPGAVYDFF